MLSIALLDYMCYTYKVQFKEAHMLKEALEKFLKEWEEKAKQTKTPVDDALVKLVRFIINIFI